MTIVMKTQRIMTSAIKPVKPDGDEKSSFPERIAASPAGRYLLG
jgi:hypothetical protein